LIKGLFSDTAHFNPIGFEFVAKPGRMRDKCVSVANTDSCSGQDSRQTWRRVTTVRETTLPAPTNWHKLMPNELLDKFGIGGIITVWFLIRQRLSHEHQWHARRDLSSREP
jgi:hypothetical protein